MGKNSNNEMTYGESRRFFMKWGVAFFMGVTSLFVFFLATLRMSLPSLLPGKSGRFKIGSKEDFPAGTAKYFKEQQVYVFADQKGIFAISAVCTHLGCIVNEEETQFTCPCHGSEFDLDGNVIQGPAPKDLPWYNVTKLPNSMLVVDKNKIVQEGTRLKV